MYRAREREEGQEYWKVKEAILHCLELLRNAMDRGFIVSQSRLGRRNA